MPRVRIPHDTEIAALAGELRPLTKHGEPVRHFLRRNQTKLSEIVEQESWGTLARVLTLLEITYSTGKPWTAEVIRIEFTRSKAPRKKDLRANPAAAAGSPALQEVIPAISQPPQTPPLPVAQEEAIARSPLLPPSRPRFVAARTKPPPEYFPPTEEELRREAEIRKKLFNK